MTGRFVWATAFGVFLIANTTGCGSIGCDTSDKSNPAERYTGGLIVGGEYHTSLRHGEWLHFPGGKRYELVHNLGVCPDILETSISFSQNGDSFSSCAGNTCVYEVVGEQSVIIKNDTCADYWLFVALGGNTGMLCDGGAPPPPDASIDSVPSDDAGDARPEAADDTGNDAGAQVGADTDARAE